MQMYNVSVVAGNTRAWLEDIINKKLKDFETMYAPHFKLMDIKFTHTGIKEWGPNGGDKERFSAMIIYSVAGVEAKEKMAKCPIESPEPIKKNYDPKKPNKRVIDKMRN